MKELLVIAVAALSLSAADATGTWTGTLTSADDAKALPAHLVLKQDGDKLTGTAGPDASDQHAIQNGKAENGILTFELPAGSGLMKFNLKQEGEEIAGDVTRERDGQMQTAKLAVKRSN